MASDDPFQLLRQPSPAVSSGELQGLGKRASYMYLGEGTPLNDAVVKIAQQHPGITSEQVRRIVEFANQHTFSEIFEKQAGDKNVDFEIADPFEVLRRLNDGASPPVVKVAAAEYSMAPVRPAYSAVECDLALAEVFGVKLAASQAMVKSANPSMAQAVPAPGPTPKVQMGLDMLKKKEESAKAHSKMLNSLVQQANGQGGAQAQAMPAGAQDSMKLAFLEVTAGSRRSGREASLPEFPGIGREAVLHVKTAGEDAELVRADLEKVASLEAVREATAGSGDYPRADPYADLHRARQYQERVEEEVKEACEKNFRLVKEALDAFSHHAIQHLYDGGNLGEIGHAVSGMADAPLVKAAMDALQPGIEKAARSFKLDPVKLQVDAIHYEMAKEGSHRQLNPKNPMVEAFAAFVKAAEGQQVLEASMAEVSRAAEDARELAKLARLNDPRLAELLKEAGIMGAIGGAAKGLGSKLLGKTKVLGGAAKGVGQAGEGATVSVMKHAPVDRAAMIREPTLPAAVSERMSAARSAVKPGPKLSPGASLPPSAAPGAFTNAERGAAQAGGAAPAEFSSVLGNPKTEVIPQALTSPPQGALAGIAAGRPPVAGPAAAGRGENMFPGGKVDIPIRGGTQTAPAGPGTFVGDKSVVESMRSMDLPGEPSLDVSALSHAGRAPAVPAAAAAAAEQAAPGLAEAAAEQFKKSKPVGGSLRTGLMAGVPLGLAGGAMLAGGDEAPKYASLAAELERVKLASVAGVAGTALKTLGRFGKGATIAGSTTAGALMAGHGFRKGMSAGNPNAHNPLEPAYAYGSPQ